MPRAASYATNTCTTLMNYIDQMEFISVEMKKAYKNIDDAKVGACHYCNNDKPVQRFSGCVWHKCCNQCHVIKETIVGTNGCCAIRGCNQKAVWPPLRDLVLEKTEACLKDFEEQAKHGFAIEKTKHDHLVDALRAEKEARVAAETALSDANNAMQVADDAEAPAAAAPVAAAPRGRKRICDCETEEEKDEIRAGRREQEAATTEKRRKLANYDQLKKEFDAVIAVGLTPEQEAARDRVSVAAEE